MKYFLFAFLMVFFSCKTNNGLEIAKTKNEITEWQSKMDVVRDLIRRNARWNDTATVERFTKDSVMVKQKLDSLHNRLKELQ
jgi:hypothetical protein